MKKTQQKTPDRDKPYQVSFAFLCYIKHSARYKIKFLILHEVFQLIEKAFALAVVLITGQ